MTTNEPPPYPGDSTPGETPPPPPPTAPGESGTSGLPSYGSVQPPAGETPPPPPPPPPAPGGSGDGFNAPDAIGWGWRKFTQNVGPILLAVVVFVVVEIVVSIIGGIIGGGGGSPFAMSGSSMDFSLVDLIVNLVSTAISIVLSAGFARAALDVVDGRPFDFFGAFGKLNLVNVIIAALLVSVLVTIGFILLVLPGIIVLFLTYFTTLYVVDDDAASPVQAITDSVKLVSSRVGDSLLLALLNILVIIAGVIALVVGLAVAYPVTALASAYAYRRFREQPVAE
jgi:uncharacterized membrane protein